MVGLGPPPHQNSFNNLSDRISIINSNITSINSDISTLESNLSTVDSHISDLYSVKADKYYNYKVINIIPDNANLNNYLTVGSYSITSNASAKTMTNLPVSGNSGTLYVINCLGTATSMTKTGYEYFLQIFLGYTAFIYIRAIQCNNSTISYGDWKSLI